MSASSTAFADAPTEPDAMGGWPCPECDRVLSTRPAMLAHIAFKHKGLKLGAQKGAKATKGGKAAPASRERKPAPLPTESEVRSEIAEAVANLKTAGAVVSIIAPHTGIYIAGVVDPETGAVLVRSRAERAGSILEGWALRDYRVLAAIRRFNAAFKGSEAAELVAGLGAAGAVDFAGVDPHIGLELGPFRGENAIRPVMSLIGDVVGFVEENSAPPVPEPAPMEKMPGGGEFVPGGVEGT